MTTALLAWTLSGAAILAAILLIWILPRLSFCEVLPVCKCCRYPVYGLPDDRCPECGSLLADGVALQGEQSSGVAIAIRGILWIMLAGSATAAAVMHVNLHIPSLVVWHWAFGAEPYSQAYSQIRVEGRQSEWILGTPRVVSAGVSPSAFKILLTDHSRQPFSMSIESEDQVKQRIQTWLESTNRYGYLHDAEREAGVLARLIQARLQASELPNRIAEPVDGNANQPVFRKVTLTHRGHQVWSRWCTAGALAAMLALTFAIMRWIR